MAQTAIISRTAQFSWVKVLTAPFTGFGRFLIMLAETSPKMRELNRLGQFSDAELAEKGLTRDGEVRRIMGLSAYI